MDKISMITLLLARAYTDKKTSEVPAVIQYKGVTTTELYDGATTNPITINGNSYTAVDGDVVFYQSTAYAYDGSVWQATMSLAQIITALEDLEDKIGDLTDLTTTDKDSVVDAINELVTTVGGKQDTLTFDDTPTDNSNNPVKSNGVYDALALKQDKTDNTLQTTSKTVVGAVNELKSGLTSVSGKIPIRGSFSLLCNAGNNVFTRDTMTLSGGSIPQSPFNSCIMMIVNHASNNATNDTIQVDGANTIVINAQIGQIISVMWLDASNIPIADT